MSVAKWPVFIMVSNLEEIGVSTIAPPLLRSTGPSAQAIASELPRLLPQHCHSSFGTSFRATLLLGVANLMLDLVTLDKVLH